MPAHGAKPAVGILVGAMHYEHHRNASDHVRLRCCRLNLYCCMLTAPSRITTRTVIESVKDARGHGKVSEPAQVPDVKVTCFWSSAVRDRAAIFCAIDRRRTRRASRRLELRGGTG